MVLSFSCLVLFSFSSSFSVCLSDLSRPLLSGPLLSCPLLTCPVLFCPFLSCGHTLYVCLSVLPCLATVLSYCYLYCLVLSIFVVGLSILFLSFLTAFCMIICQTLHLKRVECTNQRSKLCSLSIALAQNRCLFHYRLFPILLLVVIWYFVVSNNNNSCNTHTTNKNKLTKTTTTKQNKTPPKTKQKRCDCCRYIRSSRACLCDDKYLPLLRQLEQHLLHLW